MILRHINTDSRYTLLEIFLLVTARDETSSATPTIISLLEEQIFSERKQTSPPSGWHLMSPIPDIGCCIFSECLDDRSHHRQNTEQTTIADDKSDEDIGPVRDTKGRKMSHDQRTDSPLDETVNKVDGENVGENQQKDLSGQDLLDPNTVLGNKLTADREDDTIQTRFGILWVASTIGLGDGKTSCPVGMDPSLNGGQRE